MFAKKPYTIKSKDSFNFLSLGKDKKFYLIANGLDRTNFRNKVLYKLANDLDVEFTPKTEMIHLYINGGYKGLYMASTRKDVNKKTLPLSNKDFLYCLVAPNPEQKLNIRIPEWQPISNEDEGFAYVNLENPEKEKKKQTKSHKKCLM